MLIMVFLYILTHQYSNIALLILPCDIIQSHIFDYQKYLTQIPLLSSRVALLDLCTWMAFILQTLKMQNLILYPLSSTFTPHLFFLFLITESGIIQFLGLILDVTIIDNFFSLIQIIIENCDFCLVNILMPLTSL